MSRTSNDALDEHFHDLEVAVSCLLNEVVKSELLEIRS